MQCRIYSYIMPTFQSYIPILLTQLLQSLLVIHEDAANTIVSRSLRVCISISIAHMSPLTLENSNSIGVGVKCGEYGGRKYAIVSISRIDSTTPSTWCTDQLSSTTILFGFLPLKGMRLGNNNLCTKSMKISPSTDPLTI